MFEEIDVHRKLKNHNVHFISFVLEVRFYYYLGNEQTKQEKK